MIETIESTIKEHQKANKNNSSSGSSNENAEAMKRRRQSKTINSDNNDDDFAESTVQSKKRATKIKNAEKGVSDSIGISNYDDRCIDIDLDGYDSTNDESNQNLQKNPSGRVLPLWSKPGIKGNSPIGNLFEEYAFKK